jgi:hypothetical protein
MTAPQTRNAQCFFPFVLVVGLVFGFPAITEYASGPDTQVQAPVVSPDFPDEAKN